jgi:hypothetical protein
MKHVTDQNWFAVGLDVLVVITGIFLGMQVTEWNDNRKDRIDGQDFIGRIHNEILAAEQMSSRVRDRRLNLISTLTDAAKIIFDKNKSGELTDAHCLALATSHYLNIAISELPSLTELISAGRVAILEDHQLRTALIAHQQKVGTLKENTQNSVLIMHNLPIDHPGLIKSEPYYDAALGEMQARYKCDLMEMRKSQAFLNAASENVDGYDAYLRDGLRPWSTHLTRVHYMLDSALGIEHDKASSL